MSELTASSYSGDIKIIGGMRDGETLRRCRVFVLGDVAKVTVQNQTTKRFEQVDRLIDVEATEGDGVVVFSGVSEELTAEVGLAPTDAMVRYSMELTGCQDCQ